ncbi:Undecaprenyl diphosphate synthase [hydrothermal vent metagenome]|uniref:Undecaprenyl diphosphate synthase n=1 Tax=hydrothermal vent metagenome TaxID=652676 RepID=A0A3B0RY95_9ZZZZ
MSVIASKSKIKSPAHVAIVMDGNGRWSQSRGKSRRAGHQAGVDTVRKIVKYAASCGTQYLTLYSFSTENWKRPKEEIQALFGLLKAFVKKDLAQLNKANVQITVLGSRSKLPEEIKLLIEKVEIKTAANNGLNLNIAFNYGGRDEIVRMTQKLAKDVQQDKLDIADIDENMLCQSLDTAGQPDPDMIIRTGGENRISNFLLWQSAYAEFILLDVLWPDFCTKDYDLALEIYGARRRRMGGLNDE